MITALQAETMCLCLHLRTGHLYYEVHQGDIQLEATEAQVAARYDYDPQLRPLEAISEALYNTPLLTLPYARVYIYYTPEYVHLLPQELHRPESECSACLGEEVRASYSPLAYTLAEEGQVLIGALQTELVQFFARQYLHVEYLPSYAGHFAPMIEASRQSGLGQMLVYLEPRGLSLVYTTDRHIAFINRYAYVSPWQEGSKAGEVVYYLSLVVEALGLSFGELSLHIATDAESEAPLRSQLAELLL